VPASLSEQAGWFQLALLRSSVREPPRLAALGIPPKLGGEFSQKLRVNISALCEC